MTKQVQLSDDAYERLRTRKRPGESFSDVVLRLTPPGSLEMLATLNELLTPEERREQDRLRAAMHAASEAEAEAFQKAWQERNH